MHDLIFEIGTEEIPAGYIEPALKQMAELCEKQLTSARIQHGTISTFGTPRRLAILIKDVAERQESIVKEEIGPPKKVGFDDSGQPKIPAERFVQKFNCTLNDLRIKQTPKGEYLCLTIKDDGQSTDTILQRVLPDIISTISFPKTMRWASQKETFARPIHSILAILGSHVVAFEWAGIKSSAFTHGHLIMRPAPIQINTSNDYRDALHHAFVIPDISQRKNMIQNQIKQLEQKLGGKIKPDEDLLNIVTHLVEYPVAIAGTFSTAFLDIPKEILITVMRVHQKYFALEDSNGNLLNYFIAVNNTKADDMTISTKGHERVLLARLSDARFFYQSDIKVNPDHWIEKLKTVLFQAKLGTVYEKTIRIQTLVSGLADQLSNPQIKIWAERAAWLCKTDLMSEVVGEFPNLQGIMGKIYATYHQEPDEVAQAIEDHYRPVSSGSTLPQTLTGSLLAIADKIDTICGCFSVGLKPTGAADPYALRRQGIGIIQILKDNHLSISLSQIIQNSLSLFKDKLVEDYHETFSLIRNFFQNRMLQMLVDDTIPKDLASAVLSVSIDHIPNVWHRAKALSTLKSKSDFEQLAITFKRVGNMIRKTDMAIDSTVQPDLIEHDSEKMLVQASDKVKKDILPLLQNGDFDQALLIVSTLKEHVDLFFDSVLVMTDNEAIRLNRMAILNHVVTLFDHFADFTKIST